MSSVENLLKRAAELGNVQTHRSTYTPTTQDAVILSEQLRELQEAEPRVKSGTLRNAVHTQIQIHSALLAPIRRLPFELLSRIFCCASSNASFVEWEHYDARIVRTLTQVCYTWREVATQTAVLWAHIRIYPTAWPSLHRFRRKRATFEDELFTRLSRTAESPLRVELLAHHAEAIREPLLSLICGQSHRWDKASICGMITPDSVGQLRRPYPILRELRLNIWWDEEDDTFDETIRAFEDAPSLRRVYLACSNNIPLLQFPPSWTQITHLEIDRTIENEGSAPFAPCIPALAACAGTLRWCKLFACKFFGLESQSYNNIHFPVLEDLFLRGNCVKLCRMISAPKLRTIELKETYSNSKLAHVRGFLERSGGCTELRSVSLIHLDEDVHTVLDCVRSLPPSVQSLVVKTEGGESLGPLVTIELVQLLTRAGPYDGSLRVLPGLQHLELDTVDDDNEDNFGDGFQAAVLEMRASRMLSGWTLNDGTRLETLMTFVYDNAYHVRDGQLLSKPVHRKMRIGLCLSLEKAALLVMVHTQHTQPPAPPSSSPLDTNGISKLESATEDLRTYENHDFLYLHRTYYAPSPWEASAIAKRVRELEAINAELASEHSQPPLRQHELRREVALGNALLSPCRRLPSELWSEIFCQAKLFFPENYDIDDKRFPFTRLCHLWRSISHETPELWSDICITLGLGCPDAGFEERAYANLARAGQSLIAVTIVLEGDDVHPYFLTGRGRKLWAAICDLSSRWKSAYLDNMPLSAYKMLFRRSFPSLQELRVSTNNEDLSRRNEEKQLLAFANAPNLRAVDAETIYVLRDFKTPSSWRLTHLFITYDELVVGKDGHLFSAVMSLSQTLQECSVNGHTPVVLSPAQPITTFPCLQKISLESGGLHFLSLISAPKLQRLVLSDDVARQCISVADILEKLLDRSSGCPELRYLSLRAIRVDDMLPIMRRLPHLTGFELEDKGRPYGRPPLEFYLFVKELTRTSRRPASLELLPNLTHLVIKDGRRPDKRCHAMIGKAIESRSTRRPRMLNGQPLAYKGVGVMPDAIFGRYSADSRAHDDEQVPETEPPIRRRSARLAARANVPVHRLPPEILGEIFLHFCQLVLQSPYFPDPIPTLDTTITCVCRRWRQIAYGTPQLWRYIASPTRRIKAYLERYVPLAKGCPLFAQGPDVSTAFLTFMKEIRPHAFQLDSVILMGMYEDFERLMPFDMINLKYVRVRPCLGRARPGRVYPLAFIKDTSRIESLHLDLFDVYDSVISIPPMASLTTLNMSISLGNVSNTLIPLRQCHQTLITLRLTFYSPEGPGDIAAPYEPLEFPALRKMHLEYNSGGLLQYVAAPSLEQLIIDGPAANIPALLLGYLRRTPSTTTHLRLLDVRTVHVEEWDRGPAHEVLAECFVVLEGLETLRFSSYMPPRRLFQRLMGDTDALPLLPKLKLGVIGGAPLDQDKQPRAYKEFLRVTVSPVDEF
ncbi:uncharacterized protein SCHCODRAFT_02676465 [Schizophyllum commune H4-8]|uniref:F-box domain-containing protein n=1 Tax=Schizophyllum commune (strain H4-8 / FGSC 9210) TaxID=578458 RepID=D8PXI6_SCHCM|nr:uncharacterized protein SCHCODRAFT_02676465 [Schizophyllum commune H4-8]KAI5896931.1 hypothetical protein SCHCODRAFT_02676465 [Schizophyllum commune H4-8]